MEVWGGEVSPTTQMGSPSKPNRQMPPPSSRVDAMGANPRSLVGKVLQKITRSPRHPTISLHFADSTVFQIHIEGYHPQRSLQGIPKELEMDSSLDRLLSAADGRQSAMNLLISDCALVQLTDKAFQKQTEERWDQNHLGLAFKFAGDPAWHCVWATVVEYDEYDGGCTFRSYDDVYLQPMRLGRGSPQKVRSMGLNGHRAFGDGK